MNINPKIFSVKINSLKFEELEKHAVKLKKFAESLRYEYVNILNQGHGAEKKLSLLKRKLLKKSKIEKLQETIESLNNPEAQKKLRPLLNHYKELVEIIKVDPSDIPLKEKIYSFNEFTFNFEQGFVTDGNMFAPLKNCKEAEILKMLCEQVGVHVDLSDYPPIYLHRLKNKASFLKPLIKSKRNYGTILTAIPLAK